MPVHKVCKTVNGHKKCGWEWGDHGKIYATKKAAEKQMRAAFAHGYKGKRGK